VNNLNFRWSSLNRSKHPEL